MVLEISLSATIPASATIPFRPLHVKYIYKKNIDFYRNQMNQNVLHNKMLNCMANFNYIIDY